MNGSVRRVEGKVTQGFSVGKVKWANLPCVRLSKPMEFQSSMPVAPHHYLV